MTLAGNPNITSYQAEMNSKFAKLSMLQGTQILKQGNFLHTSIVISTCCTYLQEAYSTPSNGRLRSHLTQKPLPWQ